MKKFRIVLTLMIILSLFTTLLLTACSSSDTSDPDEASSDEESTDDPVDGNDEETEGPDISEEVKLYGYLLGAAPAGFQDVMDELNVKLKEDINTTMEINYIGWSDMQSRYPLVLAAGE